ncbi:MAG: deoxyribodipyrimidine photolyase [Acidimicrobiaceae bacterium]|jgi:deoxyribodipyrimidine photo-lyase|nr:deoxyribodipyrimidine photolyase [Acidimicrobiaceae bacterium]|tara:strand:- start:15075 stop:16433 length:1359 start_codon:yes stop_codon:yes gene_type:complete
MSIAVCWFRKDLRLNDNPAWGSACSNGAVIPIFVLEPSLLESTSQRKKDVLFSNLIALQFELESVGGYLLTLYGPSKEVLPSLLSDWKATSLHFNKDHAPAAKERDKVICESLNIDQHGHWGNLILPPGTVVSGSGSVHKVFTPFYKKWVTIDKVSAYESPTANFHTQPRISESLQPIRETPSFETGSSGAYQRLKNFLPKISEYETDRDYPSINGTSLLSSDLHFGTIGPREVLELVGNETEHSASFIRQLAWRDWYAHLMDLSPEIVLSPANPVYKKIEWRNDVDDFDNWVQGKTGYPIVDAGMRELMETGFMHNRVRMITGSFLVKHLLIDWRWGEKYFRHTLIDGDTSQNVGNWQWVAGTGFDASPYFRIFNPIRQSEKFDKEGTYIRKWIPELSALNSKQIHSPWEISDEELNEVGVRLGTNYPFPIVDHSFARERCLETYKAARAN